MKFINGALIHLMYFQDEIWDHHMISHVHMYIPHLSLAKITSIYMRHYS